MLTYFNINEGKNWIFLDPVILQSPLYSKKIEIIILDLAVNCYIFLIDAKNNTKRENKKFIKYFRDINFEKTTLLCWSTLAQK